MLAILRSEKGVENENQKRKKHSKVKKHLVRSSLMLLALALLIVAVVFLIYIAVFNRNDRKLWRLPVQTIESNGTQREYRVYVPKHYDKDRVYPMLMLVHGYSDNGRLIGAYTGAATLAERQDVILVLPEGYRESSLGPKSWNSGICCGDAFQKDLPDSKLLADITEKVSIEYSIDNKKRYIAGFSNGAMMVQKAVIDYPDTYKAMAVFSGSIGANGKVIGAPEKPANALFVNGDNDPTVPSDGGKSKTGFVWKNRQSMIETWTKNCDNKQSESLSDREVDRYQCDEGVVVQAELRYGLGHRWPGARHKNHKDKIAEGTQHMWEFFESLD